MKKRKLAPAIIAALLLSISIYPEADGSGTELSLPSVKSYTLDNGVQVFYVQDSLPQLTVMVSIGHGMLHEERNTAGMSRLITEALTISGSKKYPGNSLHETIDNLGGKLSIESSFEETTIYIKVLKRFRNVAFDMASDLLINPNFTEKHLSQAKGLVREEIRRSFDDPARIAFMKAREIIFNGRGYGAFATEKKINSYTLEKVRETWDRHAVSGNVYVGVSSSVSHGDLEGLISSKFTPLGQGKRVEYTVDLEALRKNIREKRDTVFLYPKEIPQSTIVIGTVAPDIHGPGTYPLSVMNYVLGGGSFNSRLMREIRVKRGLAYSVMSLVRFRYKTGIFLAFAQTANTSVPTVLSLMHENIGRMAREPVSKDEITWAKNSIENSHVFEFTTSQDVLANAMEVFFNRLPEDYYVAYVDKIREVSPENIVSETEKLIRDGLITVVVGRITDREAVKKFGTIKELPVK